MRRVSITAAAAVVLLALAGCASDPLAEQYADGSGQGYVSGDGAYTELPPAERTRTIEFEGTDELGQSVSSAQFSGDVYVVNFWYAGCPPCRVEAPDLKALSEEYSQVPFLGVNIRDSSDLALTFAREFEIEYPSVLDARTASVQLAFSGLVAPDAVP
ncbi:MAG: TlpA family protein disulfide reductase, partial [Salinibacterium sp.]|nr:TlpA family protein disulfide reductase [Salinibacterium sp.]